MFLHAVFFRGETRGEHFLNPVEAVESLPSPPQDSDCQQLSKGSKKHAG